MKIIDVVSFRLLLIFPEISGKIYNPSHNIRDTVHDTQAPSTLLSRWYHHHRITWTLIHHRDSWNH